ncbi:MAG: hypothetical protein ABSC07_09545 [Terriglobales bacterium]|jgi:hypothetical protein
MQRARRWIALGLLLAAPVVPAQKLLAQGVPAQNQASPAVTPAAAPPLTPPAAPAATPNHKSHKVQKVQKVQKELVLPPLPSGPLSQMPMDQIPATPAKVSFENGLLTISAQNSTLGEILRDVRKLTGASIEIPQGSGASERVIAHLGPGAPRDVLAGLLNGSSFNYVMIGTSSDRTAVASVILTAKPSSGDAQTAANVPNNPLPNNPVPGNALGMPPGRFQPVAINAQNGAPQPGQPGGNVQPVAADEDSKDDEPDTAEDTAEDQAQPAQTDANANANANAQPQQPDPNQPNAGPKTPEQILDMLRRQQQPGGAVVPPPQPPQQ